MKALFLLAVFVPSAAIATPTKFDLECTGQQKVYRAPKIVTESFKATYHIDLDKSEYCVDACSQISKLQDVDSLQITLVDFDRGRGTLTPIRDKRVLDRRNGNLSINYLNGATLESLEVSATCRPLSFTPFPETQF
jgi:hypothetical protein